MDSLSQKIHSELLGKKHVDNNCKTKANLNFKLPVLSFVCNVRSFLSVFHNSVKMKCVKPKMHFTSAKVLPSSLPFYVFFFKITGNCCTVVQVQGCLLWKRPVPSYHGLEQAWKPKLGPYHTSFFFKVTF